MLSCQRLAEASFRLHRMELNGNEPEDDEHWISVIELLVTKLRQNALMAKRRADLVG